MYPFLVLSTIIYAGPANEHRGTYTISAHIFRCHFSWYLPCLT
jgi:hypothetical protein